MSTPYEIPLSPQPQYFQIALAGTIYSLNVYWNDPSTCWVLDIADDIGTPIVQGIPLVTGVNLLAQYAYLGIAGRLEVQSDTNLTDVPTFTDLGIAGHLYFITTP